MKTLSANAGITRSAFASLFLTVFLDSLGFMMVFSYLYFFARSLGATPFGLWVAPMQTSLLEAETGNIQADRTCLFDKKALKKTRYTVERFFSWVKACRRIDTRYDRLASSFLGFIQLACILILFNHVLR